MNQTVRAHGQDANSLSSMIREAINASPHSPEYDRIVDRIDMLQLPTWKPHGAAQAIHNQEHHLRLSKVSQALAPKSKVSWIKRLSSRPAATPAPSIAALGESLHEIEAYLDDAQLSLVAIEREYRSIDLTLSKLQTIQARLANFQQEVSTQRNSHDAAGLFKAIYDKTDDIARLIVIYQYSRASFQTGAQSLKFGMEHARVMKKAIKFALATRNAIDKDDKKISHVTHDDPLLTDPRKNIASSNRIDPRNDEIIEPCADQELRQLAEKLEFSIIAQKQAIEAMTETSKAANALCD